MPSALCDCPNCRKDNILNGTLTTATCECCTTPLIPTISFQIMPDKTLVCEPCIKLHFVNCSYCVKPHRKSTMKSVKLTTEGNRRETKEGLACPRCFAQNYRECMECHEWHDRHSVMSHGDKVYCKTCFDKSYRMCSHCNVIKPKTQIARTLAGSDRAVCEECYAIYGPIQSYETKPKFTLIGKEPHFYGTELEVELIDQQSKKRGAKADEVVNLFDKDFVITKNDGSIKCGFEIVSQPASLDEHKIRWAKFFAKLPDNLQSFNTTTCGLHVHCSRAPLSLLTIAKMVVFVNDDTNRSFIEAIAGRSACRHSHLEKKEYAYAKPTAMRGSRYEAVNLMNRDTVEFRMFKGTLKKESFFKAIEFCDALIHFCSMARYSISQCRTKENFITYVQANRKNWPHLYAFICAKVLKKENKLTKEFGYTVESNAPSPTEA
jgi:hypothetical protein